MNFFLRSSLVVSFLLLVVVARATIGTGLQMQLGNPSSATADPNNRTRYLIQRPQYALDYNDTTREPNWVAWNLTSTDVGSAGRSPDFFVDTSLPAGFYQVLTTDYSGSGYDRGHMTPSGDRTVTRADNDATFLMSNMIPQAPDNNQGVWASFETYSRTLAAAGNEVLIISGPSGFAGSSIASGVAIPSHTWKIAVVVPLGAGTAASRITTTTRVIAIKIPNIAGIRNNPWQNYITSAAQIEADTGYTFFTDLSATIRAALRVVVDGQTATGAPAIAAQPTAQSAPVGGNASFTVSATGNATLTYQWLKNDNDIAGATTATLALSSVQAADAATYTVVVTNSVGSVTSAGASLVITGLAPSITTPPPARVVAAGSTTTFTVSATGSPTLSYQWRKGTANLTNGGNVSGATTPTLTLTNVQAADAATNYNVVVTNSVNSATSADAALTVNPAAPTITTQPTAQSVTTGSTATLTVVATGTAPLAYQWRKAGANLSNGGTISGATSATLSLANAQAADMANYDVVISNGVGANATSNAVALTVSAASSSSTIAWDFATATPTSGLPADVTGGTVTQNNNNGTTTIITTTSASSGYTGSSGTSNAGAAARIGALDTAASGSAYFEFTLTPATGKQLNISEISFGSRSTGTGPQAFSLFTSVDNFATAAATGTLANNSSWALHTRPFTTLTGTTGAAVTVRLFAHNGAGGAVAGTANWRIDDLKVTVNTIAAPPTPPAIASSTPASGAANVSAASAITLSFNQPVNVGTGWFAIASAAQGNIPATVTGGPSTFTLTPPGSFLLGDTITVTLLAAQITDQATGLLRPAANSTLTFGVVPPTAPSITTAPLAQAATFGGTASFTVVAAGTAPLSYQWRKGGVALTNNPTASTATLSLSNVQFADAANYDVVISNGVGSPATSTAVALTVNVPTGFTVGNIVALRIGSGTGSLVNTGNPVFLDEFSPTGALVQTIALPTAASGNHRPIILGGTATSEGALSRSSDGRYLVFAGYGTAVGGSSLSGTNATAVNRVVARINGGGGIDTTTALTDYASSQTPRSAVSADGSAFWLAGSAGGVRYATLGATTSTSISTTVTNLRVLDIFLGQLYTSSGSGTLRVGTVGTGLPTATGQTTTNLPGFPTTGSPNAYLFADLSSGVAGADTLYVADDAAGLQKFSLVGGAWTATGSIALSDVRGIAATIAGGTVTLFATTSGSSAAGGGKLYKVADAAGYNGTLTGTPLEIAAAAANSTYRGVAVAPVAAPSILAPPVAQTATAFGDATFSVVANGSAALTYQWRKGGVPLTNGAVSGSATIAGATSATLTLTGVTATNAGDYDVVIANPVNPTGLASPSASLTVNRTAATVALANLNQNFGTVLPVTATTTPAGLAVALTYGGSASLPSAAGTFPVVATITDPNYTGTATATLMVNKATATVSLAALNQTYNGTPRSVTTATNPAVAGLRVTYNGDAQAPTAAGSYAINVIIEDSNYSGGATGTLTIAKAAQTVAFAPLPASPIIGTTFPLSASATSGLPVALALVSGNATLAGTSITLLDTSPVTLRATQAGDANTLAASAEVTITATAAPKQNQTITFAALADRARTAAPQTLTASASSGLTVAFELVSGPATLSNGTLALTGSPGTVVVRATQSGNASFNAAPTVERSFRVLVASFAGTYFGTLGNGGTFALIINADNTGVFLAFAPGSRTAYVSRNVTIDATGRFRFVVTTTGGSTATASDGHTPPIAAAIDDLIIEGTIAENGTLSGASTSGATLAISGSQTTTSGSAATTAGFYQAGALGSSATTLAIVSPTGQTLLVTQSGTTVDGGTGTIDATGRVAITTAGQQTIAATFSAENAALNATVTNATGATTTFSGVAAASAAANAQRIVNLSTRTSAGTGDQVAIAGFVITGPESKTVLVRGIGPALRNFGVTTALGAPRLDLMRAGTAAPLATNSGWSTAANSADLASAAARSGAFALTAGSADSAILTTLAPGNYTAIVSAATGPAGVALVEVYDLSGDSPAQRLVNLSTRAAVGTGDNTLIAGVVIGGTTPKRVLIRAAGPALAQFGVSGVLARPQLTLLSGSTVMATNAGWSTSADATAITDAAARTGAFAFGATSADAAILIHLAPGAYTAQVTGIANTTGTALIEIYEVP